MVAHLAPRDNSPDGTPTNAVPGVQSGMRQPSPDRTHGSPPTWPSPLAAPLPLAVPVRQRWFSTTQIRLDTPGRAYYRRKIASGKSRAEAMRCLRRRISDALYRQLRTDAKRASAQQRIEAGPGGHRGATHKSSAAGSHPHTGTSDQPLPEPAPTTLPAPNLTRKSPTSRPLEPAP